MGWAELRMGLSCDREEESSVNYSVVAYFFTIVLTVFNIQDVDGGWF
jgi:hypothetical protein